MRLSGLQSRCLLLLIATLSLLVGHLTNRFEPLMEIDSSSYIDFNWSSLKVVLSDHRTFGYPLFLKTIRIFSNDPRVIPYAHSLAVIASAFVFFEGLVASGYRRLPAVWAAGALMFGRGFLELGCSVTADSLAGSLAIAATGCFLASCGAKHCRYSWLGLALLTFAAYQTRPAYLFLIALWPVTALLVDRLILRRDAAWLDLLRRCAMYCAVTAIPFVAFCTLRWGVVGHWGLVSFGGYNLIGVVGQFLDEPSAQSMPDDLRPVALAILERRSQLIDAEPPVNFESMERMYNPTIWQVAVPTVRELNGDNPLIVNRVLSQLSGNLLRQHRSKYFRWLVWNGIHALKQVVRLTVTDTSTRLIAVILLIAHAWRLLRGPNVAQRMGPVDGPATASSQQDATGSSFVELHLLFWIAVAFAAAKGLLVILVEPANDRYMAAAMPLLPAAIAVFGSMYFDSRSGCDFETGSKTR